ncbi:MAG: hypothetical protein IKO32_12535 [Lachnospiraceae bacterium]|nr:hypothetical protein [Lachnospiraceae bacterium]
MKKYVLPVISGFLSTYSLLTIFHAPLKREFFEESTDFLTANIYDVLGEYSFLALIVFSLCLFLFLYLQKKGYSHAALLAHPKKRHAVPFLLLGLFFGFTYALGKYYIQAGTSSPLFDSFVNVFKFILCVIGFALLAFPVLTALADFLHRLPEALSKQDSDESGKISVFRKESSFFGKNAFLKAFIILLVCYLPFLIVSFPGNLCFDVIGQIEQVLSGTYSTHHPLLHTLWVGGFTYLGGKLFSSYEAGLFLYVLSQTLLLITAFASVIAFFAKKKIPGVYLYALMILFVITPIYTNLSTTALKDVPFAAFVLLYLIFYSSFLAHPEEMKKSSSHLLFVFLQIGVICMRNNGLPLVILSGIIAVVYLAVKEKKIASMLRNIGLFFLESLFISQVLLLFLGGALHAEKGSRGEIFSLPFQQTAYYLTVFEGRIPEAELTGIEAVLGEEENIRERYDVTIADPVKALFKKDASMGELANYLAAYAKGGLKHPYVYSRAFFLHTYGWYCPEVTNEIRYETDDYETIRTGTLFPNAGKIMIFFYRFANRIFPFGLLENIGFAFWALSFLTVFAAVYKKGRVFTLTPHWIGFLVCLASPCFFGHPRYALPILAGLPFSYLFIIFTKEDKNNV